MNWKSFKKKLLCALSIQNKACYYYFDHNDKNINSILCLTPSGIGDVIMQAPAIAALKNAYPESHITVLGHENRNTSEVCELMPSVDEVVDIGIRKYTWLNIIVYMFSRFWVLCCKLRKKRYDLIVSFMPNPVRKMLLITSSTKYWVYGNKIDAFPGKLSLDILKLLGIPLHGVKKAFEIPIPKNENLLFLDSCKRPVIGIHPFCGTQWRQWNHFDELINRISSLNATVVTVGKQSGYNVDYEIFNLVNMLSLSELFWVINKCDVFVTADSGPMHIAFSLNVPTVAIFGVVKPSLRVPYDGGDRIKALYKPNSVAERTSLAIPRKRLNNQAMQSITVDEVVKELKQLLNHNGWNI